MTKKIAELTITDKYEDRKLLEAINNAGFVLTLVYDGLTNDTYIISKPIKEED